MKAQGISLTTIIIAAICLIVLIVLIVIFSGNIKNWNVDIQSCETKGGTCVSRECTAEETELPDACKEEEHCCLKILD